MLHPHSAHVRREGRHAYGGHRAHGERRSPAPRQPAASAADDPLMRYRVLRALQRAHNTYRPSPDALRLFITLCMRLNLDPIDEARNNTGGNAHGWHVLVTDMKRRWDGAAGHASEPQADILRSWDIDEETIAGLTRAAASELIRKTIAEREEGPPSEAQRKWFEGRGMDVPATRGEAKRVMRDIIGS